MTTQETADEFEAKKKAAMICSQGGAHQWVYRGTDKGYRCTRCLFEILKPELKRLTD